MFDFQAYRYRPDGRQVSKGPESPYIIYLGGRRPSNLRLVDIDLGPAGPIRRLQPLIAKTLRTELPRSIYLAMATIC